MTSETKPNPSPELQSDDIGQIKATMKSLHNQAEDTTEEDREMIALMERLCAETNRSRSSCWIALEHHSRVSFFRKTSHTPVEPLMDQYQNSQKAAIEKLKRLKKQSSRQGSDISTGMVPPRICPKPSRIRRVSCIHRHGAFGGGHSRPI